MRRAEHRPAVVHVPEPPRRAAQGGGCERGDRAQPGDPLGLVDGARAVHRRAPRRAARRPGQLERGQI
eukprot:40224-Prymnesium_polylepis.2